MLFQNVFFAMFATHKIYRIGKVIVENISYAVSLPKLGRGECIYMRLNFRMFYVLVLCLLAPFIIGCEETVQNPELPYEEKVVIGAYLVEGEKEAFIEVSRTLPLLQKYTPEAATITNAEVTIICPEGNFNALYDSQTKSYRTIIPTIRAAARYELEVKWKGKTLKASTRIPELPDVIKLTATVEDKSEDRYSRYYSLTCDFTNNPNICVGLLNELVSSEKLSDSVTFDYTHDILNSFYNAKTAISNGEYIRLKKKPNYYFYDNERYKFYSLFFAAFDAPYHAMNLSGSRYDNNDNIFGSSGSNPKFNISGDGIGYFIGVNVFPRIYWVPID